MTLPRLSAPGLPRLARPPAPPSAVIAPVSLIMTPTPTVSLSDPPPAPPPAPLSRSWPGMPAPPETSMVPAIYAMLSLAPHCGIQL